MQKKKKKEKQEAERETVELFQQFQLIIRAFLRVS
jgi:hypothetical protein